MEVKNLMMARRSIPTLTSAQVKQVDQMTSERFGIAESWLMEAAGWQLARFCRRPTYVLCGRGNNGGDGLAVARHLHRWGLLAGVACTDLDGLSGPAMAEAKALQVLGITPDREPRLAGAELVLDALLGTGLTGAPSGEMARWIDIINASGHDVVAVDLPSGLVADSGTVPGACVIAAVTVTLCLPKPALLTERGTELAGEIWVVDIGIPDEVYALLGIEAPGHLFATEDRVRLRTLGQ
ncbi:MAG: NAD(P)H-hydrate epimerase [Chloroflexi bacterium]|nr:MAG: NAD(P)H-hydrate epimerase [Chloroflexota bacterium]